MSLGRMLAQCEACGSAACLAQAANRCRHTGIPRTGTPVDVTSANTPDVPPARRGRPPKRQQGSQAA